MGVKINAQIEDSEYIYAVQRSIQNKLFHLTYDTGI
jgi:hypothetical protein